MQTNFAPGVTADPLMARSERVIRSCVHCGFCTATCPTYALLGDERDSPRGRIYLIKEMLEENRPATDTVVRHVDRCLSCLACMTTCPSGVNYMHLVDHARAHIEETYERPFLDRAERAFLSFSLSRAWLFRLLLLGARLARPIAGVLPAKLRRMLAMAPTDVPLLRPRAEPVTLPAPRKRVALLAGCVQPVLGAHVHAASLRLLARRDVDVVMLDTGCCGSLAHHLGKEDPAKAHARRLIGAVLREADGPGLDAVLVNVSGCGTTMKDYGAIFAEDPDYAAKAARVAGLTREIGEFLAEDGFEGAEAPEGAPLLAYHAPCSLQHGQNLKGVGEALLAKAGFTVRSVVEGHLCCGSAGVYNILEPDLSDRLKARKVEHIEATGAGAVATANVGCAMQIAGGTDLPVVHTVELLDWATGGPRPEGLC